jgi:hypothetical protein
MNTATATTPKNDPAEAVVLVHPAERWMYKKINNNQFWVYYRARKEEYARFSAQDVARLAQRTNTDFWFLVFKLGLGIEVITVDQVKEYYQENRPGYTVDTVATYE